MGKGEDTRGVILDTATGIVRRAGLGGLTIGSLAASTGMSKSGLFAHFGSKEALQLQVLGHAEQRFTDAVIRVALKAPRGEPRVRELFERWLAWDSADGGCPLMAASFELDDQPGATREYLVRVQRDWTDTLATVFTSGITEGHFAGGADPYQFAQDIQGVMLAYHMTSRLLADDAAERRARQALDGLLAAAAA